jgi:hypothetical protein
VIDDETERLPPRARPAADRRLSSSKQRRRPDPSPMRAGCWAACPGGKARSERPRPRRTVAHRWEGRSTTCRAPQQGAVWGHSVGDCRGHFNSHDKADLSRVNELCFRLVYGQNSRESVFRVAISGFLWALVRELLHWPLGLASVGWSCDGGVGDSASRSLTGSPALTPFTHPPETRADG